MVKIKDTYDKFAWKVNIMSLKIPVKRPSLPACIFLKAIRRLELMRYRGAHAAVV
jgi:hypothetical protein